MAASVARRRDDEKVAIQPRLRFAFDDALYAEPDCAVGLAHHALAAELPGEGRVIGYVIPVRQEHRPDSAEFSDPPDERRGEARRINQHVAARFIRADDQITPRPIARFRSEAAEIDVFGDERWKRSDGLAQFVFRKRADGCCRAGDQSLESLADFGRRLRLAVDARLIAVVAEMGRRDLAARVAVDARVVNKEIARDVLRQSPLPVSHARLYNSRNFVGKLS